MTDLDTAHKVCTPNELKAFTLSSRGMSQRSIALAMNLSRARIRNLIDRATTKIERAQRKDAAA